jgi:chitodextrinase
MPTPTKKPPQKTSKSSSPTKRTLKTEPSNRRLLQACFAVVFAALATVVVSFGFAATAQTSFSGTLSKKQPVRSHSISTSVSGTISASLSNTKNATPLTIKLMQGSTLIAQSTGAPATISAPVSSGTFTFEVSANVTSPTQYVLNLTYPVPDSQPVGDMTAPSAPFALTASLINSSQVNLTWQSSTDNVGVTGYTVYRNGITLTTTTTTAYSDVNLSPSTSYTYTVKARDSAGNVSAASNAATVTTPTPSDTTAPNVTISTPVNGATIAGTVNVSGTSSDNTAVSKVELSIDNAGFMPVSGTTSWSYGLNTSLFSDGTHTIRAKATDSVGNQTISSTVSVTVKNSTAPPPTSTAPNTQGTWISPEGARFEVTNTVCPITLSQLYNAFMKQVQGPGDYAKIAPILRVGVNDYYGTATATGVNGSPGSYSNFQANINYSGLPDRSICFNGVVNPDAPNIAHEYGHAWTIYHFYMSQNGSYSN